MNKPWLLFDMSSVLWQNLLAGKDKENGRDLPDPERPERLVHVQSATFGFENFVANFVAMLHRLKAVPRQVVMVFEGEHSKLLRQSICAEYKAGRSHHPAAYEEFQKLKDMVRETLLGLGALAVHQDGIEADDVICYLSKHLKRTTVVSNDGDMVVLQSDICDIYRTETQAINENKYGPFDPRLVTLYKALVGDSSDRIKGAFKYGPKAFIETMVVFGEDGMWELERLVRERQLERLAEDVAECKPLQRILDSMDSVYMSYDLARMYPEKVNTLRKPLQVQAGMVTQWDAGRHDKRLQHWYGTKTLVHAGNLDEIRGRMLPRLLESPEVTFDLESSTPPESDEWLEAKKHDSGGEDGTKLGVDVLGSELTSFSMTFGDNGQHTIYATIDHVEQPGVSNISSAQGRQLVELVPASKPIVVHNASFELAVLYNAWAEAWENNGWHGFLPNVYCTKVMKSYVDENSSLSLKKISKEKLGYEQTSYLDTVTIDGVEHKMNQLTAAHVFDYGCDDTICTSAVFNWCRFWMEIEDTLHVYEMVERYPTYLNAARFIQGTPISMEKMFELERADAAAAEKAWETVRTFLIKNGWEGTVCPQFANREDFTPARVKEAYLVCTGEELKTQVRTPEKLFKLIGAAGHDLLATLLEVAYKDGVCETLNEHLKASFKGEPEFNPDSPKQMQHLLYEVMKLPVRLYNKPTDAMRAKGIKQGNPRGDDFALQFAIKFDADRGEEITSVLKAIQDMRVMATRHKLYYVPYRHVRHWKDNLVHPHVNQCATVTRRYSASDPNMTQLPKNAKHGHKARFREVYVPHHKRAVVVSLDFNAQELRNIAEQSQDANLLACYVPPPGAKKKDMHAMTAAGIWKRMPIADLCRLIGMDAIDKASAKAAEWMSISYERFIEIYKDPSHPDNKLAEELRQIGKKVNFTTEYGAQAKKLSETLIIPEKEAQTYIDAKLEQFPRAEAWKKEVVANEVHRLGYTTTMLGGRRHLAEKVLSLNKVEASGAERQGVNYKIQGSCAEQTKLAEGRIWQAGVLFRYDCVYIGPVHDELVFSVGVDDLVAFLHEVHGLMTENYADMKVPVISSISFGLDYGRQIEVGETVDEDAIRKALHSIGLAEHNMTMA